jgi:hypothetical protein
MKKLIPFILLISHNLMAQLAGNWQGQMVYNQQSFPTQFEIKVVGQKVTGRLILSMGGVTEVSILDAKINDYSANKSASGKITDAQNNTANILFGLEGNQLNISIAISPPNGGNMIGGLVRGGNNIASEPPSQTRRSPNVSKTNDWLPRDPELIGTWSKFSTYTRNSMNTDEYWTFNADGTMEGKSRSYAIIYDRVEGNYDGGWVENQGFKAEREAGIRWFTKDNNKFFNKMPDGSEVLQFYYTIEHYNGKINMFARKNPNQPKAGASFTKVN